VQRSKVAKLPRELLDELKRGYRDGYFNIDEALAKKVAPALEKLYAARSSADTATAIRAAIAEVEVGDGSTMKRDCGPRCRWES